ncbi:uncharacterized protein [Blastocystis hominis]|uniref:Uncharacterized protein n=1 Tax=Blastocystis hominis TaxID=12968 RepID=D8MBI6_BLAHO|nr:uncharacterized protein [Blastocystis hominis]CBK25425.2 unnamed protein product [Blastocystis hominis]|eukprot:XP_012899473.1 uncharacterized protein [Blastocystis hominis]
MQLKIKGILTTVRAELEAGVSKALTPFSRLGFSAGIGLAGVELKWKYQRGSVAFAIPVVLSRSWRPLAVALASAVTAFTAGILWIAEKSPLGAQSEA